MSFRRTAVALTIVAAVALAGLASAAAAPLNTRCPGGTTNDGGLCVAKGSQAQQAAGVVQSVFTDAKLGAAIVGIWKGGKPLVVGALGESMTGVPATVDMHHITGNITNAMLSTVLLQQVEKGKLSLDDKLSKYFPDLPAADQITIEMLENSTSGYEHYAVLDSFDDAFYADPFKHWTPDEVIAYGVAGGPRFTPGTQFKFSDTNFLIVAQVLEKATGTSVASLMEEGIFKPLGMKDTVPPETAATPDPVLHAHTGERGVWEDPTSWDPSWTWYAGGIRSNQRDLQNFLVALGKGTLLTKADHQKQLARPANSGTPERYFALGVPVVNGWVFTNPSLEGYSGALGYLPAKDLSIVVYTTRTQQTDPSAATATTILAGVTKVLSPDNVINAEE
jgi:CubicO group peptidase (beta-lactamase class C family)